MATISHEFISKYVSILLGLENKNMSDSPTAYLTYPDEDLLFNVFVRVGLRVCYMCSLL